MQEEMEKKAVAISIKAGKLSANLLKAAIPQVPGGNGEKPEESQSL